jgi:hypothetical protein
MRLPRVVVLVVGAMILPPPGALAGSPDGASADGPVTVLEPIFVEASTGAPWIYFSEPGFEVISHCSSSFNQTYARALELAAAARLEVLPESFWGNTPTPIKIVLYDRKPEQQGGFGRGSPIDLNWVSGDGGSVGADVLQHSDLATVGDGDTFINCGNFWNVDDNLGNFSVDPDSDIRLGLRVPRLPAWFVAGMVGPSGLYSNRIIEAAEFSCALVLPSSFWISGAETTALQNEAKDKRRNGEVRRRREMLPLGEMFSGAGRADRDNLWNCEAALLVRWGLYGSGSRQAFLDFVDETSREPVTEPLFRRYMGMGYAEALGRLGDYLPGAASEPIRIAIAPPRGKPLDSREATSPEVARIIGDWGRLEGRSSGASLVMENYQYKRDCLEEADRLFERINRRGDTEPLFLAAFGLYEAQIGYTGRARDALEAATRAGVVRPAAYVELARIRFNDALPSIREGIGDLSVAEFTEITGLLAKARVQMPAFLPSYDLLARVLEHAPSVPTRADIWPLKDALDLFPQDAAMACRVAKLYRAMGMPGEAAAVVDRAGRFSDSDKGRALLAQFRSGQSK